MTEPSSAFPTLLDAFFQDLANIEVLESRIARFNVFEAMGARRNEVRHSNFLATLLTPEKPHGMGDAFLRQFLYRVLSAARVEAPVPAEAMVMDLSEARVLREERNIDLLVEVPAENLLLVIENKVDAAESPGQLAAYEQAVDDLYGAEWQRVLLFLSPDGRAASRPGWRTVSYLPVAQAVDAVLGRAAPLQDTVAVALRQYRDMLMEDFVQQDENRDLAVKLYNRHQELFDFVFSCLPSRQEALQEAIQDVLKSHAHYEWLSGSKSFVLARPAAWRDAPQQALRMEFQVGKGVRLHIAVNEGAPDGLAARLIAAAQVAGPPMVVEKNKVWTRIYHTDVLPAKLQQSLSPEDAVAKLTATLTSLLDGEVAQVVAALAPILHEKAPAHG